jgi:hypothetical protein
VLGLLANRGRVCTLAQVTLLEGNVQLILHDSGRWQWLRVLKQQHFWCSATKSAAHTQGFFRSNKNTRAHALTLKHTHAHTHAQTHTHTLTHTNSHSYIEALNSCRTHPHILRLRYFCKTGECSPGLSAGCKMVKNAKPAQVGPALLSIKTKGFICHRISKHSGLPWLPVGQHFSPVWFCGSLFTQAPVHARTPYQLYALNEFGWALIITLWGLEFIAGLS